VTLAAAVAVAGRLLALAAVWWALAEGEAALWTLGAPAIAAGLAASLVLSPQGRGPRLRLRAVPAFAAFFAAGSLRGGVDVAARVLRRRPGLDPAFLEYRLRLPPGAPRHLFAVTLSLLPGTLSTKLADDMLTVHVLDARLAAGEVLGGLEERVGALFGPDVTAS
jgi:multicomponent Na+:H+ antiporter subunit E